jgi:hypothetical protein
MRKLLLSATTCVLVLAASPVLAGGVSAEAAFDQLKSLAGTWTGEPEGVGEEAKAEAEMAGDVVHEIQVSAAGTVVMETMNPGTEHEMINMYHRDGDGLMLTHYCAGGNQPQMRLDRESSTADMLVFDYAGGTNHDPAVDPHIHSARIQLIDGDNVLSKWTSHVGGEEAGGMNFHLTRSE